MFIKKKQNINFRDRDELNMAEDTGFEPAEPFGSTVFKTAAIDHSANPPQNLEGHTKGIP